MYLNESYLFQEFSVSLCGLLDEVPHSPPLLAGHHHTCLPKCHCHLHDSTLHFIQNAGPLDVGEDNAVVMIMQEGSTLHVTMVPRKSLWWGRDVTKHKFPSPPQKKKKCGATNNTDRLTLIKPSSEVTLYCCDVQVYSPLPHYLILYLIFYSSSIPKCGYYSSSSMYKLEFLVKLKPLHSFHERSSLLNENCVSCHFSQSVC